MGRNLDYLAKEPQLIQQIIHHLKEGLSIPQISKIMGIPTIKINRLKKKHNIPTPTKIERTWLRIPPKEQFLEDYHNMRIEFLAKKYHANTYTIKDWLKHYGVIKKRTNRDTYFKNKRVPPKEELIEDYKEMMLEDILTKHKISERVFRSLRKEYGIPLRHHRGKSKLIKYSYIRGMHKELHDALNDKQFFLDNFPSDKFSYYDISRILNIGHKTVKNRLKQFGLHKQYEPEHKRSSYEDDICSILDSLKIEYQTNKRPFGIECDIFISSLNKGIEFNGTYWHRHRTGKLSTRHLNKFQHFKDNGISLFQIYEHYWRNDKENIVKKLKDFLFNTQNIAENNIYENDSGIPMECGTFSHYIKPDYVFAKNTKILTKQQAKSEYGRNFNAKIKSLGFYKIYDAGKSVYINNTIIDPQKD